MTKYVEECGRETYGFACIVKSDNYHGKCFLPGDPVCEQIIIEISVYSPRKMFVQTFEKMVHGKHPSVIVSTSSCSQITPSLVHGV
jgi:hypothetical protein